MDVKVKKIWEQSDENMILHVINCVLCQEEFKKQGKRRQRGPNN